MLNMINQIQVNAYSDANELELISLDNPPSAIFVDEYELLTIKGDSRLVGDSDTIVTSRRHTLSKTFGDVDVDSLVEKLNDEGDSPKTPNSADGYSVIGVEVWGYGVSDIKNIIDRLDDSIVVVSIEEYVACLNANVFM